MPNSAQFWWSGQGGNSSYCIAYSLRFSSEQWLQRDANGRPAGDFTISCWIKYATTNPDYNTFYGNSDSNYGFKLGGNNGTADLVSRNVSVSSFGPATYRDPSAWYHFVLSNDNETTSAYVNGVLQPNTVTPFGAGNPPAYIGAGAPSGGSGPGDEGFRGQIAEFYMIDGQALGPDSFAQYNECNIWMPKKYDGTYGTTGYHFTFAPDTFTYNGTDWICEDQSGNNQDFVCNNFELSDTTSDLYDVMQDSPTQNYATLQPLGFNSGCVPTQISIDSGNLGAEVSVSDWDVGPTIFGLPESGKYYIEVYARDTNEVQLHVYSPLSNNTQANGTGSTGQIEVPLWVNSPATTTGYYVYTTPLVGTVDQYVPVTTANADMTIAIDATNKKMYIGNGETAEWLKQSPSVSGTLSVGSFDPAVSTFDYSTATEPLQLAFTGRNFGVNFGNHPFHYTPPAGYEQTRYATDVMPTTPITQGTDGFRALTGAGASILSIAQGTANGTGIEGWGPTTGFASGLWWIKGNGSGDQHQFVDIVRNNGEALTMPDLLQPAAFTPPAGNASAWCWKYEPNDPGRLGFDIVRYTGNGTTSKTVTHNLGTKPAFIITKHDGPPPQSGGTQTGQFIVYHHELSNDGLSTPIDLNLIQPEYSFPIYVTMTSTEWTIATSDYICNELDKTYMAYAWSEIPFYSKFGKYVGNANADGPFVYTGFRPAWILLKGSEQNSTWFIFDTTTNTVNHCTEFYYTSTPLDEQNSAAYQIDILSNGFKIRNDAADNNPSVGTMIYAAFAEHPFGGCNNAPVNAR